MGWVENQQVQNPELDDFPLPASIADQQVPGGNSQRLRGSKFLKISEPKLEDLHSTPANFTQPIRIPGVLRPSQVSEFGQSACFTTSRTPLDMDPKEKKTVALHESGHAVAGWIFHGAFPWCLKMIQNTMDFSRIFIIKTWGNIGEHVSPKDFQTTF